MLEPISVITINYNNLNGLKRTLDSVFCQTQRQKLQFIVVDGGSTDGSAEYLKENASKIDLLIIEKDKGIYDAMNKGLQKAHGCYVWFVNSGDIIYNSAVTENILPLILQDPDVIFGDTMFTDAEGNDIGLISKMKPQPLPQKLGPNSFRYGMCVCHQSFISKRSISPMYDLKYKLAADIHWIIEILKNRPTTARFQGVISGFETGGSSYQNEKKALKERYEVLQNAYGTIPNFLAHIWIAIRRILFKAKIWRPGT